MKFALGPGADQPPALLDLVADFAHGSSEILLRPRPARRVNSRRAAETVDLKSGIVGERRKACAARRGDGFETRVALKRRLGFLGFGEAKLAGGNGVEAIRRDQLVDLPHLAGVVAGDDKPVAALQGRHQKSAHANTATDAAPSRLRTACWRPHV